MALIVPSPNGLLMSDRDDVAPTVVSAAKRRMLRRLRSHWRHEQFSISTALASAVHDSHMRVATQTDFVLVATYAATAEAPQVVGSFLLSDDFATSMYNQVHQEQLVTTIQPHAFFHETPEVQVVDRILEQIVEPTEVLPQERVIQRTSKQIVHVPVLPDPGAECRHRFDETAFFFPVCGGSTGC